MKKLIALVMTLALIVTCCPALAVTQTAEGVGTFTLPDGYTVDDTSYTDGNNETSVWLFDAYTDTINIEAYNVYLDSYAGQSLSSYTEDELKTYIDDTTAAYTEDNYEAAYVKTVMAGTIPFLIYVLEDDVGPYYYAETLSDGWCINLSFYNDEGTLPESELPTLETVLKSFSPAA